MANSQKVIRKLKRKAVQIAIEKGHNLGETVKWKKLEKSSDSSYAICKDCCKIVIVSPFAHLAIEGAVVRDNCIHTERRT
jgi:hypothetical protein